MQLNEVEEEDVIGDLLPIVYGGRCAGTTWSTLGSEHEYYIIVFGSLGCRVRWCRETEMIA